ncbi:hypothetical protein THASP1DRAFT_33738, partial [Thamnocephalis sphaerospora]
MHCLGGRTPAQLHLLRLHVRAALRARFSPACARQVGCSRRAPPPSVRTLYCLAPAHWPYDEHDVFAPGDATRPLPPAPSSSSPPPARRKAPPSKDETYETFVSPEETRLVHLLDQAVNVGKPDQVAAACHNLAGRPSLSAYARNMLLRGMSLIARSDHEENL